MVLIYSVRSVLMEIDYQLIIRQLQYAGVGELLLKLHALKTRLESLGWFDKTRKKPLPLSRLPSRTENGGPGLLRWLHSLW